MYRISDIAKFTLISGILYGMCLWLGWTGLGGVMFLLTFIGVFTLIAYGLMVGILSAYRAITKR